MNPTTPSSTVKSLPGLRYMDIKAVFNTSRTGLTLCTGSWWSCCPIGTAVSLLFKWTNLRINWKRSLLMIFEYDAYWKASYCYCFSSKMRCLVFWTKPIDNHIPRKADISYRVTSLHLFTLECGLNSTILPKCCIVYLLVSNNYVN